MVTVLITMKNLHQHLCNESEQNKYDREFYLYNNKILATKPVSADFL